MIGQGTKPTNADRYIGLRSKVSVDCWNAEARSSVNSGWDEARIRVAIE